MQVQHVPIRCGVTSLWTESGPNLLGVKNFANPVGENTTVLEDTFSLSGPIEAANNRIVGTTSVVLDGATENVRNMETNLEAIIADSYIRHLNTSSMGKLTIMCHGLEWNLVWHFCQH